MSSYSVTSRYTRPIKATHSQSTFQELYQACPSFSSSFSSSLSPPSLAPSSSEALFPLSSSYSNEIHHSSKELIDQSHHLSSSLQLTFTHRRASSLSSLDCYNLKAQCDDNTINEEDSDIAHRRSNSFSISDNKLQRNYVEDHNRRSIEGLNQEVSSVLEGKSLVYLHSHPDGHIAPVHELLCNSASLTGQKSSSQSFSMSPCSSPSSPLSNESPVILDIAPSLPKIAFGHKPPVDAERCTIKQELMCFSDGYIPGPPDKSKVNIVFKGNVFSPPLLPSHGLQTVTFI